MFSVKKFFIALTILLSLTAAACSSDAATTTTDETTTEGATSETTGDSADETAEAGDSADEAAETDDTATDDASTAEATGSVEVNLIDRLDGMLTGYCLDIAGGNESVDPANGLQAHTCYSYQGDLGTDQVFDDSLFADGVLYMPVYEVCAQVDSAAAGSAISLATCDGSDLQSVVFEADGTIRPATATDLCITAGSESRTGRSGDHQIRDLSVETCSDDLASLQQWSWRTGA